MIELPAPWKISMYGDLLYDGVLVGTLMPNGIAVYSGLTTLLGMVPSSGYLMLRFSGRSTDLAAVRPKDLYGREMRKPGESAEQFKEYIKQKEKEVV